MREQKSGGASGGTETSPVQMVKMGGSRYANFLKKIIKIVDDHKSTLGYEILNEPQVHISDEWQKIGKYN